MQSKLYCTGWPAKTVTALPLEESLPFLLVSMGFFMLPIMLSCVINLKLILVKKKRFANQVSVFGKNAELENKAEAKANKSGLTVANLSISSQGFVTCQQTPTKVVMDPETEDSNNSANEKHSRSSPHQRTTLNRDNSRKLGPDITLSEGEESSRTFN
jgi:hypothetical protein